MGSIYRTRGPLDPNEGRLYVKRPDVDDVVENAFKDIEGQIIALMGPRQTGKTSLMSRLWANYAQQPDYEPVLIDVSPAESLEGEAWYDFVFQAMLRQIRPRTMINPTHNQLGFRELMRHLVATARPGARIVLMLDELGTVPEPVCSLFLTTIRSIYNARMSEEPDFKRITFILGGTYLPENLIKRSAVSPFNVANRVYTSDTDEAGVSQLVQLLETLGAVVRPEAVERAYWWTNGHLYLTQRLCQIIEERAPLPIEISGEVVDEAVRFLLHYGDFNLNHLVSELDSDPPTELLVRKILNGEIKLKYQLTSPRVARVNLLGAIRQEGDSCVIRNQIYATALKAYAEERESMVDSPGRSHQPEMKDQEEEDPVIRAYKDRLRQLQISAARSGYDTPPKVLNEIQDIEAKLRRLDSGFHSE